MSIQLNTNFNLKAAIPIDTRFVFNSKVEMNSAPNHDLYVGLLSYVVSENKFYVYNGTTFNELRVDNEYFLDPVATVTDLTSIVSPKVGAVCMVKDVNRFYVFTGDTTKAGTFISGNIATAPEGSIPLSIDLMASDDPSDPTLIPSDIDLSTAKVITRGFINGWQLVANSADEISYDNSNSGLVATDVQDAIDELKVDIAQSLKDAGVNKPVNTPSDLGGIKNPKPGDTVTVIDEKKIYIFNGKEWVELKAGSEYFIDPVELKTNLPSGQKNGTICLVRSERTLYLYVDDATEEEQGIKGAPVGPAWIPLKTKSTNIEFDNSGTDITAGDVGGAIKEVHTTLIENIILDWTEPTTEAVGGIDVGYVPPKDGISVKDFLYNMTHPFVYPTISMELETAEGVFEKGTSKTLNKIVLTSSDGTKFAFEENNPSIFVDGVELTDSSDVITLSVDKKTYTRELSVPIVMNGTADKKVVAKVDLNGKEISTEKSYEFINPFYAASLTGNIVSEYNNALFINDSKILTKKSNQVVSYTHANKVMAFAYPSEYGALSKIADQNGFDITSTFSATTYMNGSVSYRVYCATTPNTLSGFNVTFKF